MSKSKQIEPTTQELILSWLRHAHDKGAFLSYDLSRQLAVVELLASDDLHAGADSIKPALLTAWTAGAFLDFSYAQQRLVLSFLSCQADLDWSHSPIHPAS